MCYHCGELGHKGYGCPQRNTTRNEKEKEIVYDFHKLELLNHFVIKKIKQKERSFMFSGFDIWGSLICPKRFRSKISNKNK